MNTQNNTKKKRLKGIVVSNKMDKTAVVNVQRFVKHKKYNKFYKIHKKYKAHDENNEAVMGAEVIIEETRPISRDKNFKIIK